MKKEKVEGELKRVTTVEYETTVPQIKKEKKEEKKKKNLRHNSLLPPQKTQSSKK